MALVDQRLEPIVVATGDGCWLATASRDQSRRIGALGATKAEAISNFWNAWHQIDSLLEVTNQ